MSAPASTAARASLTEPTCQLTNAPCPMSDVDHGRVGLAPEEVDDRHPRRRQPDQLGVDVGGQKVRGDHPTGAVGDLIEDLDQVRRRHSGRRQRADPTGVGDGHHQVRASDRPHRRLLHRPPTPDQRRVPARQHQSRTVRQPGESRRPQTTRPEGSPKAEHRPITPDRKPEHPETARLQATPSSNDAE